MNIKWTTYKKAVLAKKQDTDMIDKYFVSLAQSVNDLFTYINKNDNELDKLPTKIKKEIFEALAVIEDFYNLPNSLWSQYYGSPVSVQINEDQSQDFLIIQSDLLKELGELGQSIVSSELDEVQYHLNKVFSLLFALIAYSSESMTNILNELVIVQKIKTEKTTNVDMTKEHIENFKSTEKTLKENKITQILIDIDIDRRRKVAYRGISLSIKDQLIKFEKGDLIKDFFDASNYMRDLEEEKEKYGINYSAKFRAYLFGNKDYNSCFLHGEEIITMKEAVSENKVTNGTLKLGPQYRPIIVSPDMKNLDQLLDYINN